MASTGGNCVAFARDLTGIRLDGDAAAWWRHAEGRYERGQQPQLGAILVFKPFGRMRVGHVAVVSKIVGPHEILVDQANWVRGRVTKAISVVDASPHNDWTLVKVLEPHSGKHGRANPTYGFIYPRELPADFAERLAEPAPEHRHAAHAAHADRKAAHRRDKHRDTVVADETPAPQPAADRHPAHAKRPMAIAAVGVIY
ncbi:MAG TPA: CHAP domain-containing protein [Stellaceae bacterium]|nr:CHAP domain-containing protein [Stellaceae bacterium]